MLDNTFFTGFVVNVSNVSQIGCTSNHSIERTAVRAASGVGGGQGGGRPGEKGAGGVREAGEEGAGSGIPKVAGSGRKREKLCNIAQYFAIEKMQGAGAKKYRAGTGLKGTGSGRFKPPCPPPQPATLALYILITPFS